MIRRIINNVGVGVLLLILLGAGVAFAGPVTFSESGPEYIELGYYERQSITGVTVENCEATEPGVSQCDFSFTGEILATHVGYATDSAEGTTWLRFNEPCSFRDGRQGFINVFDADGTIVAVSGDELHFRIEGGRQCVISPEEFENDGTSYWRVTGGTGRFEGASGIISSTLNPDGGSIGVGTLRVRADLWDSILPGPPPLVIEPGAAAIQEGDEGHTVVDVPITLSFPSSEPVTVDWATVDTGSPGVATADIDYVAASGSLTFAPGETEKTIPITVNGDTDVEPPAYLGEWGLIELSNPSPNAELGDGVVGSMGVFIIVDDD